MIEFLSLITEWLTHMWSTIVQASLYINQSLGYLTSIVTSFPSILAAAFLAMISIFVLRFIILR